MKLIGHLVLCIWLAWFTSMTQSQKLTPNDRCTFKRTEWPAQSIVEQRFRDFITAAAGAKQLCLCVRSTREISFCEDVHICPATGVVMAFEYTKVKSTSGSKLKVSMLGGYRQKYISFGISNDEPNPDAVDGDGTTASFMTSGAPVFMCGYDIEQITYKLHSHFTIAYLKDYTQLIRPKLADLSDDPNLGLVTNIDVELKDGLIQCEFELEKPNKVEKYPDLTRKSSSFIDISSEPVYILAAQGLTKYLKTGKTDCWVAIPQPHWYHRYKSRYRFDLTKTNGGEQIKEYLRCSGQQGAVRTNPTASGDRFFDHCFTFGPDGCLGLTFNCGLFVGVWFDSNEIRFHLAGQGLEINPINTYRQKDSKHGRRVRKIRVSRLGTFTANSLKLSNITVEFKFQYKMLIINRFQSYIGIGFSDTIENDRDLRVDNLKYFITCIPITMAQHTSYKPRFYTLDCTSGNSECIATYDLQASTDLTGTGEYKTNTTCSVHLDLSFFGFMKLDQPLTLFLHGSNSHLMPYHTPTEPDTFKFTIEDREYPQNAMFAPHNVKLVNGVGDELYRNDFITTKEHEANETELQAYINLNPTRKNHGPIFTANMATVIGAFCLNTLWN